VRDEKLGRLKAMLDDDGATWDLSSNDKDAIRWAVSLIAKLRNDEHELIEALRGLVNASAGQAEHLPEYQRAVEMLVRRE
jgi:hypothetical protein